MNRRRLLATLGAATTVGVAGCNGNTDGGDGSDGSGSDDSEDGEPFPDAAWRDGDGLNVETLATRHADSAVEAGGATLFSTAETTHDGDAEPTPWLPSQEYESRYDLENERQYLRQELVDASDVSELYVADGEALFRRETESGVEYERQSVDRSAEELETAFREEVLVGIRVPQEASDDGETAYEGLGNWAPTADGAGEVDGERTARFASEAFDGDRSIPETVESASATVDVLESGFVPRIEQSWAGTHDGTEASVAVDIAYRDRGATLEEPEWVADAREATDG